MYEEKFQNPNNFSFYICNICL